MPNRIAGMSPVSAWEGFVGNQTPAEFVGSSMVKGFASVLGAVAEYIIDINDMFGENFTDEELNEIGLLLIQHLSDNGF